MSNTAMITLRIILYGTMIYLFNMFISSNMIANGLGLLVAGFILEPIFKSITDVKVPQTIREPKVFCKLFNYWFCYIIRGNNTIIGG